MKRLVFLLALLAVPALAGDDPTAFAWRQHPGARVPANTLLHDEHGAAFRLGDAFAGKPVILDLGYFHCPALCGVVRADLIGALRAGGLAATDYTLVALSIDPAENGADATAAKRADLNQLDAAGAPDWHYLTGAQAAIDSVAGPVGFHDRFDPGLRQFLHPTGLVILTAGGRVSSYLLGVGYSGGDLRGAVLRARGGIVARAALPVLLLCFHYDATTGRYSLAIIRILRLMGLLTVLTIGGLMLVLNRKRRPAP